MMSNDPTYYRADRQGFNPGDAATRTLDPLDHKEYTYATTRLDVARRSSHDILISSFTRYCSTSPSNRPPTPSKTTLGTSSSGLRLERSCTWWMTKKPLGNCN